MLLLIIIDSSKKIGFCYWQVNSIELEISAKHADVVNINNLNQYNWKIHHVSASAATYVSVAHS